MIELFGVIIKGISLICYFSAENLSLLHKGKNVVLEVTMTMVWGHLLDTTVGQIKRESL